MADFALDVQKFAQQFEDGAPQAIRSTSIKLFTAIIKSTPVKEGRARANWFTTGQRPSTQITSKTDKSGNSAVNQATQLIVGIKDWSTFTLTNNLPYINRLEFGDYNDGPKTVGGFSRQAPAGMVRTNITRFNKLLDEEAKKVMPK